MAKKDVVKQEPGGALAIPGNIDLQKGADLGKKERVEMADQALPFIKIAQGLSPEITEPAGKEMFPGLEVGDFFDSATCHVWKGKKGIVFVPAYYQRTYVKWRPRTQGGGFVEDIGLDAGQALQSKLTLMKAEDAFPTKLVEGENVFQIIETAYWAGHVVDPEGKIPPMKALMAMTSSFLKPSRNWNTAIINFQIPGVDGYIRWARPWKLTTESTKNEKGSWLKPVIVPYTPTDWDVEENGPFYTWLLPEGEQIWNLSQSFAELLQKDGLSPTPPDPVGDEANTEVNNEAADQKDGLY